MIVILKPQTTEAQINQLVAWMKNMNFEVNLSGKLQTIVGLIGDTTRLDIGTIKAIDCVEDVRRIQDPYKKANRKFHTEDTVVEIGAARVKIGGGNFQLIAGPCSVESEEQIITVAKAVKASGATILRGGAFKPRTSPYAFQGLHGEGLRLLELAKKETGLPIVTEIMDAAHIPLFANVDLIQIGARNMQNFELLKEVGEMRKPVLIKRGLANTLQELLMSAEYIMASGSPDVILCERGIRTFESATRNTLDISAVPVLRELTHLPVVIDPSHSCGVARWVKPLSLAAAAIGVDGLIIEVHNNPKCALCDGAQSLTPPAFDDVANCVRQIRACAAGMW
ncbi:3-deoxy-7-phosphoheptulonate synthase [Planctomycetales bacterium]|nr:3-deoxy-7-phosphoheptulonate synthase [Planctomycetales bacterium]GHT08862.1 3-deoxy-7-phosphoheptulonate synthase [Planctomycetales bacterium]GHV19215.1 3-deoxy-7-phosphoheptulonate synthase [Planctomycetales bacterium]